MKTMRVVVAAALVVAGIGGGVGEAAAQGGGWSTGQRLEGVVAQAIDGDTLRLRSGGTDVDVRVFGIDAPEWGQKSCRDRDGRDYDCGMAATQMMVGLIGGVARKCPSDRMHGVCLSASWPVSCLVHDIDATAGRRARPVAVCTANGKDVGREMAAAGWAVPFERFSKNYVAVAAMARSQKRGLWAGTFETPGEYKRQKK